MSNSEQFKADIERLKSCKGADEYASQLVNLYLHEGLSLKIIILMAMDYGQQTMLDKSCEWLEKYAANFVALPDEGQQPIGDTNAIYGTKSLLYYLRKGMED